MAGLLGARGRWLPVVVVAVLVAGGLGFPSAAAVDAGGQHHAAMDGVSIGRVTIGGGALQPLVPARLLDTRDGQGASVGPVGAGQQIELQVAGRGGVPPVGAGAVVLNVTVTDPTDSSYLTVFPTGADRPVASNLNFQKGSTVPNLVVAKLGIGGKVTLFNFAGSVHVVADVTGWFSEESGLQPMTPVRVLDTRNGMGAPAGPVGAGSVTRLQVTGRGGVPETNVAAVVLNVTATEPTAASYVTVYPDGVERPVASNLNFTAGLTVPNLVIVKVGAGGAVDFFNSAGQTHLIADVAGWFADGSGLQPLVPSRLLDTRDGLGALAGPVGGGSTTRLQVAGRGGVPASGVGAVVLNVTATEVTASSYVTVFPTGVARPNASNLNVVAGQTVPNLVIAKVGDDGAVNVFNNAGQMHLIADVVGWFPAAGPNSTTLDLKAGTVLAGSGDVLASTGTADTGGTVTVSASADLPPVGGHLAVYPSPGAPDGFFGTVTSTGAAPDGAHVITLVPAELDQAFNDIDSTYSGPASHLNRVQSLRTEGLVGEASCETGTGVSVSPTLSLGASSVRWDFSLRRRHVLLEMPIEATIGLSVSISTSLSCTVSLPTISIPIPFGTVGVSPHFELDISAGLDVGASLTNTVVFGFEISGAQVKNLSSFDPNPSGSIAADADAEITFRPSLRAAIKLFGLAGGYVDLGVDIRGAVHLVSTPCAELTLQFTLDFGFEIGKWGFDKFVNLASLEGKRYELYTKTEGCPTGNYAWVGAVDVTSNQPSATEYFYNSGGDLVYSTTSERSYSYRLSSTQTSLVNTFLVSQQQTVPDLQVELRSYTEDVLDRSYPPLPGPCSHRYVTNISSAPWSLYSILKRDPVSGSAIDDPVDGETVYYAFSPGFSYQHICDDGQLISTGEGGGYFAVGNDYDISLDCLSPAVPGGETGYCYLPMTVSAGGTRLRFDGTLSGVYVNGTLNAPITQNVHIDLTRIGK